MRLGRNNHLNIASILAICDTWGRKSGTSSIRHKMLRRRVARYGDNFPQPTRVKNPKIAAQMNSMHDAWHEKKFVTPAHSQNKI